jgi:hypothetical protein
VLFFCDCFRTTKTQPFEQITSVLWWLPHSRIVYVGFPSLTQYIVFGILKRTIFYKYISRVDKYIQQKTERFCTLKYLKTKPCFLALNQNIPKAILHNA